VRYRDFDTDKLDITQIQDAFPVFCDNMFDMYFALKRGMNKDNSLNVRLGINRLDKNIIKYICDIYFQN
jgi:hypothetical protein